MDITKKNRVLLFIIFLTICINCYSQSAQKEAKLDSLFLKANKSKEFNGNVLIAKNGKIIYEKAFGQADASGAIQLNKKYRFHIGSIAKEFNAVGIMMLKEQGKLKLDDTISKFLPELPSWANKIKIIHLLQYTSGLPQIKWNEVNNDSENMEELKRTKSLDFEPGTKYDYNNNNVFLQRRIIERITKMSFNSFVQKKIFPPIGIKNGVVDPGEAEKLFAKSFNNSGKQDVLKYNISGWTALNLEDFYKWSEAINSFKLITPQSTIELLKPFSTGNQTGLGEGSIQQNQVISHIHDGSAFNYQALLVSNPGLTIILVSNNKQNTLEDISASIQVLLEKN
ncbi:serine hydrolase domain-containing protein [Flavobacterium sp. Fl-318]|uniref:Serine hydrolase domain-containing protein n=1 Tax=Flavobacterium cupriresistens TaxID=2893885 RepID=A0ABU4R9W2_9FLAO|nr:MULTISPECIES: serine hydrolase domain-containing protein [unclassified Flavobacterium]MDX6188793.1 serine hydrolase domain-containing protein [Flavobacterium sp. Fl-318]UFH44421.1 beta-lactamase family protein [Flavobacterium sp. F-323]